MPSRISAWAVYDVFSVRDGEQVFLAAVSDTQWALLCQEFEFGDLFDDKRLLTNNDRVKAREWMMPILRERFALYSASELRQRFEKMGLPYAPITRPQDLLDDPHLLHTGGLAPVTIPADASSAGRSVETRAALLPIALDGERLPLREGPPSLGAHTQAILAELSYSQDEIDSMLSDGVIGGCATSDAT